MLARGVDYRAVTRRHFPPALVIVHSPHRFATPANFDQMTVVAMRQCGQNAWSPPQDGLEIFPRTPLRGSFFSLFRRQTITRPFVVFGRKYQ